MIMIKCTFILGQRMKLTDSNGSNKHLYISHRRVLQIISKSREMLNSHSEDYDTEKSSSTLRNSFEIHSNVNGR